MRNAFADEITSLAATDPRVMLLSGDIGNRLFDRFKEVDETRFLNCGIAEANMMGVASGLALSGFRPFVYTITPFTTTRCFEQIRVDVSYHRAPVVIVGTGSGLSYTALGPTHHSLEDMAIMRTLPDMQVFAPCDTTELRLVMRAVLQQSLPAYIRIGKKGEPDVHQAPPDLQLGKMIVVRPGNDVALVCAGTMVAEGLAAADRLAEQGVSAEVVSCHSVKPLDIDYLQQASQRFKLLVSAEEHGQIGRLFGAISEWSAASSTVLNLLAVATPDEYLHEIGSQAYARQQFGLSAEQITDAVQQRLQHPAGNG